MASKSRLSTQVEPSLKVKSTITSRLRENDGKYIRQLEQKDQEILDLKKQLHEANNVKIGGQKMVNKKANNHNGNGNHQEQRRQMEAQMRKLNNEKLELERKLQQQQQKPTADMRINEKMLKTIRFKAALCQKLELELQSKEEEIIQRKSENFLLLKKLDQLLLKQQKQESNQSLKGSTADDLDLEARIQQLEQAINGIRKAESGYLSLPSTTEESPTSRLKPSSTALNESDLGDDLSNITEVTEENEFDQTDYAPRLCVALEDQLALDFRHLSFHTGQLIKVLGKSDVNGFVVGEISGKQGLCSSQALTEIVPSSSSINSTKSEDNVQLKVALYDYNPAQTSPNFDAHLELSFLAGDILRIYGDMDSDGFYLAELNGRRGLVPSNYIMSILEHSKVANKHI